MHTPRARSVAGARPSAGHLAADGMEAMFCPPCPASDGQDESLARGTTLHQIVFQFMGTELVHCEFVAEEKLLNA